MRRRGLVSVIGVLVAGVALASAGAGVAMKLDRKSPQSVIRVLDVDPVKANKLAKSERAKLRRQASMSRRALVRWVKKRYGVDARRAVIQRGKKNYAGPKCPGKGWTCAKPRGVVLQLNQAGHNRFKCSESYGFGLGDPTPVQQENPPICVVVQISAAGNNHAECAEHNDVEAGTLLTQHCQITQSTDSGNNHARVDGKAKGTEQDVQQTADVNQFTADGNNHANIDQDVHLAIHGTGASQKQDAHQRAGLDQDTDVGDNHANVRQSQNLDEHATGAVVNQRQNTEFNTVADCAGEEPFAPNSCADVFMDTEEGNNQLNLDQVNRLDMHAKKSAVGYEQQGSCESGNEPCNEGESPDGGTEASVDMFSDAGNTSSHATGSAIQKMPKNVSEDLVQRQFADPWCCFGTFFVGDKVTSDIDLEVDQTAGPNAYQAGENGVACVAIGDGDCSARMTVSNNEGTFTVQAEGDALFGNQDCRSEAETGTCEDESVITTTETGTTGPGPSFADLDVEIVGASPNPAIVGQQLQWDTRVTNIGTQTATGVQTTHTLTGAQTITGVLPGQGSCTNTTNTVNCNLGTFTPGQQVSVLVFTQPTAPGALGHTVSASSPTPDSNPANNSDSETVTAVSSGPS
jgi:hypothetical protein